MRVYLLRHTKPAFPGAGKYCLGRTDWPLCEEGLEHAARLGECFGKVRVSAVYCSDRLRCRQTAGAIARVKGMGATPLSLAREIDMGAWDGLSFAEIRRRFPEEYAARGKALDTYRVPGGETFAEVAARGRRLLHMLAARGEDALVVAHAGFNRALLAPLLGIELFDIIEIKQPYGCVNILEYACAWSAQAVGLEWT